MIPEYDNLAGGRVWHGFCKRRGECIYCFNVKNQEIWEQPEIRNRKG